MDGETLMPSGILLNKLILYIENKGLTIHYFVETCR